jgi:WD40 repeat protein
MMRRIAVVLAAIGLSFGTSSTQAQGTKLWTQSRYEDLERGTADGVGIGNDSHLEVAPARKLLYTTTGNYVWAIAANAAGDVFLGRGGTASNSAIVTMLTSGGNATDIFAGKEMAIQALRCSADGALFAATSPDGKVYRIDSPKAGVTSRVIFDSAETSEKPKYLWDLAIGKSGDLYIAAGAPAVVYKIAPNSSRPVVLFKTADQHIRSLLFTPNGTLFAGSDGAGVIYKFDTTKPDAKPFALYSAARREITSLALDASGNLYAAGVGTRGPIPLPNLPVAGGSGITLTFVQPASSAAATTSTIIPEGSEIYKIAPDGSPTKLLTLKEDVVYALAIRNGNLFAATGNRGRIYRIDTAIAGRWTDVAHLDASQATAFAPNASGLLVATSNSGRAFQLSDSGAIDATYTSAVFDAQIFSRWGSAEVFPRLSDDLELYVRSGNVENPLLGWSEWTRATPNANSVGAPPARYLQWKTILRKHATIDSVAVNYLPRNIAPLVEDVVVQPGARVPQTTPAPNLTVQVNLSPPPSPNAIASESVAAPLTAQKDKTAVTIRWSARDDNGDELNFAIYYRGEKEQNWRLLKEKVTDRFYSFDSSLLPDGIYTVKILASDSPSHTASESLSSERASEYFVVDTTPPVPGAIIATLEGQNIRARFDARDATSPIIHAEYSVDAGPWQYLEPSSGISDSLAEHYDFLAAIPTPTTAATDAKEHVIAIRVYDRYENAVTAKAIIR